MYKSSEITAITEALEIIRQARHASLNIFFAWKSLNHAYDYLDNQIAAHFSEVTLG